MATSIEHYQESERLLRRADKPGVRADLVALFIQAAQVHATLALAAVTALNPGSEGGSLPDYHAWFKAASVEAPIPLETDAGEPRSYTLGEAMAQPGGIDALTGGAVRHMGFSVECDDEH